MTTKPDEVAVPSPGGTQSFLRSKGLILAALAAVVAGAGAFWFLRHPTATEVPGKGDEEVSGPPVFEDVTARTGIKHPYRNGQEAGFFAIVESLGGGVALFDYDGDGLVDVFVTGGGKYQGTKLVGRPCKLYKNLGNFRFKDVTKEVGLDKINFYTHGCAVADFNCDGRPDLLVTGWGRMALFQNVSDGKGGRKFIDVTKKAHLTDRLWTTSAAWADLDGDGYPDLYVCQYVNWSLDADRSFLKKSRPLTGLLNSSPLPGVISAASGLFAQTRINSPVCPGYTKEFDRDVCAPKVFKGLDHVVYRNNRNGTFTNVTHKVGLNLYGKLDRKGNQVEVGKGLGVISADFNNDGRPDIYVANDTVDNFLYMNRTPRGQNRGRIRLEEIATRAGVAGGQQGEPNGSMGVAVSDYNRSGLASIFVANYEDEMHAFYRNNGNENFMFVTDVTGIAAIGQKYVGFGTAFLDLDNDGWEDLVVINGHVIRHPVRAGVKQAPVLFRNRDGRRFDVITPRGGSYFQNKHVGRGLGVGDLDNDGRPDLVVSNVNEPVAVLRNIAGDKEGRNHWLGIELAGKKYRDVVGSRITVEVKGSKLTRFAYGGGSYLSAADPRHLFGLGQDLAVERVTVHWSWGKKQTWDGKQFKADRYWRLVEGDNKVRTWPKKWRRK
jgi:hypothetical protein